MRYAFSLLINLRISHSLIYNSNTYALVDIPSHTYQYTFANNPQWSRFYSPGHEIQEYLLQVVEKYGVRKYLRLEHVFQGATWLEDVGKWEVKILRLSDNQVRDVF